MLENLDSITLPLTSLRYINKYIILIAFLDNNDGRNKV